MELFEVGGSPADTQYLFPKVKQHLGELFVDSVYESKSGREAGGRARDRVVDRIVEMERST